MLHFFLLEIAIDEQNEGDECKMDNAPYKLLFQTYTVFYMSAFRTD